MEKSTTELIFEGIKSMYEKSIQQEAKYIELSKENVNLKNPGVFKIFQHFLKKRYDDETELQIKDDLMMLLFNKRN